MQWLRTGRDFRELSQSPDARVKKATISDASPQNEREIRASQIRHQPEGSRQERSSLDRAHYDKQDCNCEKALKCGDVFCDNSRIIRGDVLASHVRCGVFG